LLRKIKYQKMNYMTHTIEGVEYENL